MARASFARRVMIGEEIWTLPLRATLRVCSAAYGAGVAWRNRRFDNDRDIFTAGVPVISIGNITTGGTGKTPLVVDIVCRLQDRGRRVAVLSRGYRAERGRPSDEALIVSRRAPGAVCIQDPDRSAAAKRAVDEHRADVLVLDDGFQHRRLHRDLDIVTVDATCPFGYGHLLPRGMLREPIHSLRRADLLVVTRADELTPKQASDLDTRLNRAAPPIPRLSCRHQAIGLCELDGSPAGELDIIREHRVVCFTGIGNPVAFEDTLRSVGAQFTEHVVFPDHHRYEHADLQRVANAIKRRHADLVVTTEKDAVKVSTSAFSWPCRVLFVPIQIEFMNEGARILDEMLDGVLSAARRE